MQRLSRVQKQRRSTRRVQSRGDLLRDDAALAHSGYHYTAALLPAANNKIDSARKSVGHCPIQAGGKRFQGLSFYANELSWCQRVHRCLEYIVWQFSIRDVKISHPAAVRGGLPPLLRKDGAPRISEICILKPPRIEGRPSFARLFRAKGGKPQIPSAPHSCPQWRPGAHVVCCSETLIETMGTTVAMVASDSI